MENIIRETTECLYPECNKQIQCRGLCLAHYMFASRLVRNKTVTWQQLIDSNKALKAQTRIKHTWFTDFQ